MVLHLVYNLSILHLTEKTVQINIIIACISVFESSLILTR